MSGQRKKRYYPNQNEVFPISRTGVDLYLRCPRCFYLSTLNQYDIAIPSGPMSYLPNAIDEMLKNSHDVYRERQEPTPYMTDRGIEVVPFQHEKMKDWRHRNKGIRYLHETTNLELYGAIDDVWKSLHNDELFLVDYKSTTVKRKKDYKTGILGPEIDPDLNEKGAPYKYWYKKQIEFYQWLFRKNNFNVSNIAYFLFCSGIYHNIDEFNEKMHFRIKIVPHEGEDTWVDETIINIKDILDSEEIPDSSVNCDHCNYARKINDIN